MKLFVRRTVVFLAAAGALTLAGNGVATADENSLGENAISTSTAGSDAGFDKSFTGGARGDEGDERSEDDDDNLLSSLLSIVGSDDEGSEDDDDNLLSSLLDIFGSDDDEGGTDG